jgi:hypothetical protein
MDPFAIQQKHTTSTVNELLEKYRNDSYMIAKLHNYVCIQLPTILENIKRTHEERQQRIAELTVEQDEFIERFLNTHRYFYVSTTEKFVSYDGTRYEITSEDNVLHHILTTITSEKQLMDWKQRTKVYIMKRIKDNTLLKSVPESTTIQRVLDNVYPSLFETKQAAKYFLTIIGDSLFRKNSELVYFIQPRAKTFLREIANSSLYLFGSNTTTSFKYKYYDHNYSQCRLVKINDSVETENIWGNILRNVSLDMLCVAAHYSIRYGSADEYISRFSNAPSLETYTFFLKNTSQEQLVVRFIDEYLQVSLNGTNQYMGVSPSSTPPNASNLLLALTAPASMSVPTVYSHSPEISGQKWQVGPRDTTRLISWKNMQYLWRHYLESLQLPTVIFQQNLKNMLTQQLRENYKEDADSFIGVSSRFMPAIRAFIYFWDTTISHEEMGEYEIDELCMLYKRWLITQPLPAQEQSVSTQSFVTKHTRPESTPTRDWGVPALTEKQMLDLITYYFPNTDIEKDKYVFNIRCSMWDKQMDVYTALCQMKDMLRTNVIDTDTTPIYATTIYDAYIWYCKYYSENSMEEQQMGTSTITLAGADIQPITDKRKVKTHGKRSIVSKAYFEKYVLCSIGEFVIDQKYILREWLNADEYIVTQDW